MSKVLIVHAHPEPKSLTSALKDHAVSTLTVMGGHESHYSSRGVTGALDDILVTAPVRCHGIVEGATVVRNSHRRRSYDVAVRAPPRDHCTVRRLEQLGYQVSLSPAVSIAT